MPPPQRVVSNIVNLYGPPCQGSPSPDAVLSFSLSVGSPAPALLQSLLRRYDVPCSPSLLARASLAGLENILSLPVSTSGTHAEAQSP